MKRWLVPVLVVLPVAAAGAVLAYSRLGEAAPAAPTGQPAAAQTVEIHRTDLATSVTLTGAVGYGTPAPFTGRKAGTLTWLAGVGTVVGRGQKLYAVDAKAVPLLIGKTPLYRKLDTTVPPGPDVRELIGNLRAMGYRNPGTGDVFGPATEAALKRWQQDAGLDQTGSLDVGDAVVLPDAVRVESVKAQLGSPAAAELFGYTSVHKVVTTQLDPAQIDTATVKPGAKVTVRLPDGKEAAGSVAALTTPSTSDSGPGVEAGGAPKPTATVTVDDQAALGAVESGSVQVTVATSSRQGVLAVPVTALLALAEGGYALQVVDGAKTTLVGVRLGTFANGMVEVSGAGVAEGMRVAVAS